MPERVWRKGSPRALLWECKFMQPLWKTVWFLKKLKIQLPYDPVIPLPGIDLKEMKTGSGRDSYTPVYCSISYNSLDMGTTYMSINGRMGKEDGSTYVHIYTHTHIYIKKYYHPDMREGNLAFVTPWIDLEGMILKPDRERQILHDITYIWNLKKKKKSQIHRNRMEKTGFQIKPRIMV